MGVDPADGDGQAEIDGFRVSWFLVRDAWLGDAWATTFRGYGLFWHDYPLTVSYATAIEAAKARLGAQIRAICSRPDRLLAERIPSDVRRRHGAA